MRTAIHEGLHHGCRRSGWPMPVAVGHRVTSRRWARVMPTSIFARRNGCWNSCTRHLPQVIINVAAYTGVDRAESEPQKAFRANADARAQSGGRSRTGRARDSSTFPRIMSSTASNRHLIYRRRRPGRSASMVRRNARASRSPSVCRASAPSSCEPHGYTPRRAAILCAPCCGSWLSVTSSP